MQYPLILNSFSADLKLYIPDPIFIKPTYEGLRLNNPATLFSFLGKSMAIRNSLEYISSAKYWFSQQQKRT